MAAVTIDEASAKVRTGPPGDDEEDYELPIWAGVVPLRLEPGEPVPDPRLAAGIDPPGYLTDYRRPTAPAPEGDFRSPAIAVLIDPVTRNGQQGRRSHR